MINIYILKIFIWLVYLKYCIIGDITRKHPANAALHKLLECVCFDFAKANDSAEVVAFGGGVGLRQWIPCGHISQVFDKVFDQTWKRM